MKSFFVLAGIAATVGVLIVTASATTAQAAQPNGSTYVPYLGYFSSSLPWSETCTVVRSAPGTTVQSTLAESMKDCAPLRSSASGRHGGPSDATYHDSILIYIPAGGSDATQMPSPAVPRYDGIAIEAGLQAPG